ncbi:MAG: hypothetical protein HFG89_04505 [Dorea sp.]|jgi:hypothetical protein|nr:hypothetical protein [Dorea sp.]
MSNQEEKSNQEERSRQEGASGQEGVSSQEENQKVRRKKRMIIIAFVILLVALIICILLLLRKPEEEGRNFVDRDNVDTIMEDMTEKVAEGMFECMMTTEWTFENGDSESPNAYVANVENNRYTIYFDVYEKESNELLYSSPLLPVGTEIRNIKLDKKLAAGEYKAVVLYTLVDDDEQEVSSAGFNITISINN